MAFKMKGFSAFTKTDPPVKDKINNIKKEKLNEPGGVVDQVAEKQSPKGEYVPQSRRDGDGDNPQTNQPIDKVNHYTPQSKTEK